MSLQDSTPSRSHADGSLAGMCIVLALTACGCLTTVDPAATDIHAQIGPEHLADFSKPVTIGGRSYNASLLTDYRIRTYKRAIAALIESTDVKNINREVDPASLAQSVVDRVIRDLMRERRIALPRFDFVVVDDGGNPHGLVRIMGVGRPERVELVTLAVDRELKGQGVAAWLLRGAFQKAAEAGFTEAYWSAVVANARAIRLYDRIAMRVTLEGIADYNGLLVPMVDRLTDYLMGYHAPCADDL
jgi:ribosomal protein S18 acetylase RimI-like enzyme